VGLERLEKLNQGLVALEAKPDEALADELMREIHTLKGESRMLGFTRVNRIAHKTEELLLYARRLGFAVASKVNDLALAAFDGIGSMLQAETEAQVTFDDEGFLAAVDAIVNAEKVKGLEEESSTAKSAADTAEVEPVRKQIGDVRLALGKSSSVRVDSARLDHLTALSSGLLLSGNRTERRVERLSEILTSWRAIAVQVQSRVDAMQLSGVDLTASLEMLESFVSQQHDLLETLDSLVTVAREAAFDDQLRLAQLEDAVRDLRLVPVSTLFQRFQRSVRDLAREQGKQVLLEITGDDVELDKQVIEMLAEPLLHLVRNSIDHGCEQPTQRAEAQKAPTARLHLGAEKHGAHVNFIIADDGRGLDTEAIRRVGVARAILSERDAELAPDADIHNLIFRAGFSTRELVTELSGRGVGLDVVRQRVEALGGAVTVASEPGKGTQFKLSVPVSIALIRVLVVEVGDGVLYAIPAEAIQSLVRVSSELIESAGDGSALRHEGHLIPLTDLQALLSGGTASEADERELTVVITQHKASVLGLQVRRCVGERQVLQRSLDPFVVSLRLLSGTALLEAGELVLLINMPEIFNLSAERGRDIQIKAPQKRAVTELPRVLVVDDSELTRDLIVGILRDRGYRISEAVDGREALSRIQQDTPDLIITDLDMPILDGLDLIRAVRSSPVHSSIPCIVLSTRGADEDKRAALEVGADGYIVKSNFKNDELLRTINRYLGVEE